MKKRKMVDVDYRDPLVAVSVLPEAISDITAPCYFRSTIMDTGRVVVFALAHVVYVVRHPDGYALIGLAGGAAGGEIRINDKPEDIPIFGEAFKE